MNAFDLKRYRYSLSFCGAKPVIEGIALAVSISEAAQAVEKNLAAGGYDKWHLAGIQEIRPR